MPTMRTLRSRTRVWVGAMMTRTTGLAGQQQERSIRIVGEPGA